MCIAPSSCARPRKCAAKTARAIRFDTNAAVLINKAMSPSAHGFLARCARTARAKRFMKIVSLAPEVL